MSTILSPGDVKLRDGRSVDFANLDVAATAPCLRVVADAVAELLPCYGSVHRGAGALSERCTREYEQARETVADFLGGRAGDTVVFTRNTTDALNLLARVLPAGTTVVTFDAEHHANLLPWRRTVRLAAPRSPLEAVEALERALSRQRCGLVSVTAASNVTGEVWPVAALAEVAHRLGARIAVDAAQLAPHAPVDLAALGADYVAFSGHKLYAPFGAGVLAGRADWLDAAEPYLAGGGASANVDGASARRRQRRSGLDGVNGHTGGGLSVRWATGPARHEAGTPNLLGAVAIAAACRRSPAPTRQTTTPTSRPWCSGSETAWPPCRTWRSCACSARRRSGWGSCRSRCSAGTRASSRRGSAGTTASECGPGCSARTRSPGACWKRRRPGSTRPRRCRPRRCGPASASAPRRSTSTGSWTH